jgi:hypothetical protein
MRRAHSTNNEYLKIRKNRVSKVVRKNIQGLQNTRNSLTVNPLCTYNYTGGNVIPANTLVTHGEGVQNIKINEDFAGSNIVRFAGNNVEDLEVNYHSREWDINFANSQDDDIFGDSLPDASLAGEVVHPTFIGGDTQSFFMTLEQRQQGAQ